MGALLVANPLPARASSFVISGIAEPGGNCVPFGCPGLLPGMQYQQVYDAALFSDLMLIDTISFFNTLSLPGDIHVAAYEICLSTTSRGVNELDGRSLSDNIGSDSAVFFSGTLGGPGSMADGVFSIAGSAFEYDPRRGNLLLDVRVLSVVEGIAPTIFLDFDGTSVDSSRVCAGVPCGASSGLVTRFSDHSVPEPSIIFLVATALAVARAGRRRAFHRGSPARY